MSKKISSKSGLIHSGRRNPLIHCYLFIGLVILLSAILIQGCGGGGGGGGNDSGGIVNPTTDPTTNPTSSPTITPTQAITYADQIITDENGSCSVSFQGENYSIQVSSKGNRSPVTGAEVYLFGDDLNTCIYIIDKEGGHVPYLDNIDKSKTIYDLKQRKRLILKVIDLAKISYYTVYPDSFQPLYARNLPDRQLQYFLKNYCVKVDETKPLRDIVQESYWNYVVSQVVGEGEVEQLLLTVAGVGSTATAIIELCGVLLSVGEYAWLDQITKYWQDMGYTLDDRFEVYYLKDNPLYSLISPTLVISKTFFPFLIPENPPYSEPSPTPTSTDPNPTQTPENDDAKFLQYPWGSGDTASEFNYITKSPGEEFWIDFKSLNTGNSTWKKGTYYFHNDIKEKGFGNYDRHYMIDGDVGPGGTWGYKRFTLKAPTTPGTYTITCRMGKETNNEFGSYINWVVTVKGSTTQTDDAKFLQYPWGTGDTAPEYSYITKSPGEEFWIDFKSYNTGTTTWKKTTYYFHNDIKEKGFGDYDRHYMIDSDVSPGGTWGYKRFNLKAPTTPGTYTITCRMGKETNSEFGSYINWVVTVKGSTTQTDDAKFLQYPWGAGDIAPEYSYMTKAPGEEFWIDFKSLNTGTTTWKKGTYYFHNDIEEKGFGSYDRHYMIDGDVSPGGTWGYKRFTLKAPTTPGTYTITCRMGKEPYSEFGSYINWVITVLNSGNDYHCEFVTQNSYPTLREGQSYKFVVQYKNTGNTPWTKSTVFLGTSHPKDRVPGFIREDVVNHNPSGWTAPNRITMKESTVNKGGTGTFEFYMSVLNGMEHKAYYEYFQLVTNGNTWMEDLGMFWRVAVTN